ncbi:MAG TPA: hypothetical protein VIG90_04040 [Pedomonas sp.]|uniref:hypothetical protein n=1 Tax=Pedomonas sp. TaxID=2976421 RepID=UPI002F425CF7
MGWTYCYEKPQNVKAYMDSIYTWASKSGQRRVLASAIVRITEYYCAVEHLQPDGTHIIWAGIAKLDYPKGNRAGLRFGYKTMDETVHPFFYNCPEPILNLLTPTECDGANKWRRQCRQTLSARRARPKLSNGVMLEIDNPPSLCGVTLHRATVRVINGRRLFHHPAIGDFRWPSVRKYSYRLASPGPASQRSH